MAHTSRKINHPIIDMLLRRTFPRKPLHLFSSTLLLPQTCSFYNSHITPLPNHIVLLRPDVGGRWDSLPQTATYRSDSFTNDQFTLSH